MPFQPHSPILMFGLASATFNFCLSRDSFSALKLGFTLSLARRPRLFLPAYVSVYVWQFGQTKRRFSNLLSLDTPFKCLAGGQGLEPQPTLLESAMLPLHQPPKVEPLLFIGFRLRRFRLFILNRRSQPTLSWWKEPRTPSSTSIKVDG